MIEAQNRWIRRAPMRQLKAYSIALTTLLLGFSNTAFPQQKQPRRARKPLTNVQFLAGHSALNIPFDFVDNQIVLQVSVNNSAPMKFGFDTGAGATVLSARKAAGMNLKQVDTVKATGIGGRVAGYLAAGISLSVPGASVLNQRLAVLPLDSFPCELQDIEGIIGYDFIKEFVVEINYETRTINLFDPSSYQYTGHGDLIPLIIKTTPFLRAAVTLPGKQPIEGLFELDTGSDGSLSINSPFINRHKLIDSLGAQVSNSERGLGGESKRIDARLASLQLGRFTVTGPIVGFSLAAEGSMAAEDNDGPLGNEILRRFKVTIDYSRQRMMLEPNAHFADTFESDMSGIAFDSEGRDCRVFKVAGVTEKSPAAEAGMLPGDEIVGIDGKPANQFTSTQIEKLLMQDGAERSLALSRDGKARLVKIKLRRLI